MRYMVRLMFVVVNSIGRNFVLLVEFLTLKKLRQFAIYFLNVIDEPVFEKVH